MNGINERKHLQGRLYLSQLIWALSEGEKLPGIRELRRLSGLKRMILEAELHRLCSSGQIEVRGRKGFFRIGRTGKKWRGKHLHLFFDDKRYPGESVFQQNLYGLLKKQSKEHGFSSFSATSIIGKEDGLPEFIRGNGIGNCFLYGATHPFISRQIRANCMNVVEIFPRHVLNDEIALLDSPHMMTLQMQHLFHLGHTRIGYISLKPGDIFLGPVAHYRLFDFYRILAEHGLRVQKDWILLSDTVTDPVLNERFSRFFQDPPTAVIVADILLPVFYSFCRHRGIRIGRDISVMACDNLSLQLTPQPTSITNSPENIVAQLWSLLEYRMNGGIGPRIIYTDLKILTGHSVCACRNNI